MKDEAIKPAYKRTDVGVNLEDWTAWRLGDGISLSSAQHVLAKDCNSFGDGILYLTGPADFLKRTVHATKFTIAPGTVCAAGKISLTVKGSGIGRLVLSDDAYYISRQLIAINTDAWTSGNYWNCSK